MKKKTKMSENQFIEWTYFVFSAITILPQYVLEREIIENAEKLVQKIDPKDITYVALAMQLDLPLLTRDKPLYEGLKKQGFRKIMLFEDFLQTF